MRLDCISMRKSAHHVVKSPSRNSCSLQRTDRPSEIDASKNKLAAYEKPNLSIVCGRLQKDVIYCFLEYPAPNQLQNLLIGKPMGVEARREGTVTSYNRRCRLLKEQIHQSMLLRRVGTKKMSMDLLGSAGFPCRCASGSRRTCN